MNLNKIIEAIKKNKAFMISTHVNPDPDALCSELALAELLRSLKKKVTILNEAKVPHRFEILPGAKSIKSLDSKKFVKADVCIVLDCGDLSRIGKVRDVISKNMMIINIDHHITNDRFGHLNCVDVKASSTAEILYSLFKKAKVRLTRNIALNLYAGIMTDTGCFRYSNTTSSTHKITSELCKFSFSPADLYREFYESVPLNDMKMFAKVVSGFEHLFNKKMILVELSKSAVSKFSDKFDLRDAVFKYLRTIEEAEVFVIVTEFEKDRSRVNFRSSGKVNVAVLAQVFGGGGHHNASGCMINGNVKEARRKVKTNIKRELKWKG